MGSLFAMKFESFPLPASPCKQGRSKVWLPPVYCWIAPSPQAREGKARALGAATEATIQPQGLPAAIS